MLSNIPQHVHSDEEVLRNCCQWLSDGKRVYLATVLGTWGSSPRPAGSLAAIDENGNIVGSVSGGCIETALIQELTTIGNRHRYPLIKTYGVDVNDEYAANLPCGAILTVLIERLGDDSQLIDLLSSIKKAEVMARTVTLENGAAHLEKYTDAADTSVSFNSESVTRVFGPSWRMLLIGANDVTRYTAPLLRSLNYQVVVCEPRVEYSNSWRWEDVNLERCMPDDAVIKHITHFHTGVIALTHDPKLDDMALMEALARPCFYVAALGSKQNNAKRKQRLLSLGLDQSQVDKLNGPAGLAIGSKTPAEIAIAIAAEIVRKRRQFADKSAHTQFDAQTEPA